MFGRINVRAKVLIASLGLFFVQNSSADIASQQISALASSVQWHALLHYRSRLFGGFKGLADGPDFYLSPEGKANPESELKATLDAFSKDPKTACRFPARKEFLEKKLNLKIEASCPDFEEWIRGIDAESVSYIFSTAYPNNPASMFGHTLLRLNSRKKNDLLSYAVTYGADAVPSAIGIDYVFMGLFGGYRGQFTLAPYYVRVNEYSNTESRDLWEYDLGLKPEELLFLQKHLWELYANTWFDYFFIDENCSYLLLELLHAVKPEWNLLEGSKYYQLPANTVRKLMRISGAITGVRERHSARTRLFAKWDSLTEGQRSRTHQILNQKTSNGETDVHVLDTAIETLQYRKFLNNQRQSTEDEKALVDLLRARAPLREKPHVPLLESTQNRPDLGHPSMSVQVGGTFSERPGALLGLRSGLHDFLESPVGYEPYSEMIFMAARLQVDFDRVLLRDFKFFETLSLSPYRTLDPKWAWGVKSRLVQPSYCDSCLVGQGEFRGGPAFSVFKDKLRFAGLVHAGILAGGSLSRGFALVPGVSLGVWSSIGGFQYSGSFARKYLVFSTLDEGHFLNEVEAGIGRSLSDEWNIKFQWERSVLQVRQDSRYEFEISKFF